jgi:hypothetical protein
MAKCDGSKVIVHKRQVVTVRFQYHLIMGSRPRRRGSRTSQDRVVDRGPWQKAPGPVAAFSFWTGPSCQACR